MQINNDQPGEIINPVGSDISLQVILVYYFQGFLYQSWNITGTLLIVTYHFWLLVTILCFINLFIWYLFIYIYF